MNDAFDDYARGLAGTEVSPHHGVPSYRVGGRIYATRPDDDHAHVMVSPDLVREAAALAPIVCAELWWGDKLAGVRVDLRGVDATIWRALLDEAWRAAMTPRRRR
jgi:hypothetical protein